MTVNSFDHEDEMSAAYDAAERALWHSIDNGAIRVDPWGSVGSEVAHKEVRALATRIADAVIHSSAEDIAEMNLGIHIEKVNSKRG